MSLDKHSFVVRLRQRFGAVLYKVSTKHGVPQGFLAAIIGNEDPTLDLTASRFEPHIYKGLKAAQQGGPAFWGTWTAKRLAGLTDEELRILASSWGLGQVLGINLFGEGYHPQAVKRMDEAQQIELIARRLKNNFGLRLPDLEGCLRWWNTGSSTGKTYDELMHAKTGGQYSLWYIARATANEVAYRRLLRDYPTLEAFNQALAL